MATDLTVSLDDKPGALAAMSAALGKAGVNIDGICGVTGAGGGEIHILVNDAAAARAALESAGVEVQAESHVVVVGFEDRPGELAEITQPATAAGINLGFVYVSCDGRLVLGSDDTEALAQALA